MTSSSGLAGVLSMLRVIWSVILVYALLGCSASSVVTQAPVFTATVEYEFPEWLQSGDYGSVEGSGFMRQRDGRVQTCAGNEVSLIPDTAYARERMNFIYGSLNGGFWVRDISTKGSTPPRGNYENDHIVGICDVQGRFKFSEVPVGRYYAAVSVFWQIPGSAGYQGGPIMRPVQVVSGGTSTVTISP
jgi:hypothetical protein